MKLRNKKTGEIIELLAKPSFIKRNDDFLSSEINTFDSLAELNEEWEDYEEPKEYWYVSCDGRALKATTDEDDFNEKHNTGHKQIGNYFETEKEAERAVEKLKAWKRLKDKGFRFKTWYGGSKNIDWEITSLENETYIPRQICDDLDLLFGDEGEK